MLDKQWYLIMWDTFRATTFILTYKQATQRIAEKSLFQLGLQFMIVFITCL